MHMQDLEKQLKNKLTEEMSSQCQCFHLQIPISGEKKAMIQKCSPHCEVSVS